MTSRISASGEGEWETKILPYLSERPQELIGPVFDGIITLLDLIAEG